MDTTSDLRSRPDRDSLWRIDLHMHTDASRDSKTTPATLIAAAHRAGLHRIAVTDHDTIDGALAAQRLAPDFVIVGEEIQTDVGGELIAYFVRETVPRGLSVVETLRRLRDQGAVVSISHPCDRLRGSALGERLTLEIIDQVDALEVFNARCFLDADNRRAAELARQHGKAVTAGSDAHVVWEVGHGFVRVPPFEMTPAALVASLMHAEPGGHLSGPWPHFFSTLAKWTH